MVHIGTIENRIANVASIQEREKTEDAWCEVGWNPHWIDITATMQWWERQLQKCAGDYKMLGTIGEVDEDMESEMRELEDLDL